MSSGERRLPFFQSAEQFLLTTATTVEYLNKQEEYFIFLEMFYDRCEGDCYGR
ncbi:hypothetical protein GTNG_1444 [Geobacillus thermodenitrificans NG80-2]|uniref:Uncharacterized protein n=1 Tax=Geobacillus thermodenitrificans (strain NG80-2) TaxID=420246 RepID=A4INB0_GEOTN|nr:hypothetical protein GTNG_1444 [Geobacillus thermodenitrificans NG80-2]